MRSATNPILVNYVMLCFHNTPFFEICQVPFEISTADFLSIPQYLGAIGTDPLHIGWRFVNYWLGRRVLFWLKAIFVFGGSDWLLDKGLECDIVWNRTSVL